MRLGKIWIAVLCFLIFVGKLTAQSNLQIGKVFDTYGKQKGAVLIELSTDVLGGNTNMTFYKSLIISSDDPVVAATGAAIENDIEEGSKLLESKKDGRVETGYYCLKKKENSDIYEYILYKEKSKKMTLVYIRGNFPPQQLEDELDKLKDLFIYVNKKRVKIN